MVDTFGVVSQYYNASELSAYYPDLWTLVKYLGVSHVRGSARRWAADQAAQNGIKMYMTYTKPFPNPDVPNEFASKATIKTHLDLFNIAQYQNHQGVYGHEITGEPCMGYIFDSENPSAALLNLIDVFKYACDYVRTLDPTHPVLIALDPAPAYYAPWSGDKSYIAKRKAWINLFIDFCDVLDFHTYGFTNENGEWWRDPNNFRARLIEHFDTVLIPCSKGKPIIIGECGCSSGSYTSGGHSYTFTEQQQAEYFRILGEETKKRGILPFIFDLFDVAGDTEHFGMFTSGNDGTMNLRKVATNLVKEYLSVGTIPTLPTLQVRSYIDGVEISGVPFTLTKVTLTGTLTIDTTPVAGPIYVNGTDMGDGHYSAALPVGSYTVSFGSVSGYTAPSNVTVSVSQDLETKVVGTYIASTPTDLLLNPSVESGTYNPENWTTYKSSAMQATFSWVSDAHTGTKALRIDATYNSVAPTSEIALWAQLIASFIVGKTYRFRCWYKSNMACGMELLCLNSSWALVGNWAGVSLPASTSWTQSPWITVTVPAGTVYFRPDVTLANKATGYAVFDDFELQTV